jgi:hypothetical protein
MEKIEKRLHAMDSIALDFQQITIDFIAETLELIEYIDQEDRPSDSVGALSYDISIVLDVIDLRYLEDIAILKEIRSYLKEWQQELPKS